MDVVEQVFTHNIAILRTIHEGLGWAYGVK